MKKMILLGFAAAMTMAASTGANATFFGNGEYYDSGKATYDNGFPDYRTDRHYTENLQYDSYKRHWYGHRNYCHHHPSSWKCQPSSK